MPTAPKSSPRVSLGPRGDSRSSSPSGERPRILVVEDKAEVRRSLVRLLKLQFQVVEAQDGQVAVDIVRNALESGEKFDVLVTDVEMPNMNGREALAEIAKIFPELAERAIVVSGGARDPALADWLASLPEERVVSKPVAVDELSAAIYGALR